MSDDTMFAVPKDRQAVTVRLDKGGLLEGEIFLEPVPGSLSLHHKVTAFLENNDLFFPIRLTVSGTTEFINKKRVRFIEIDFPGGPAEDYFSVQTMQSFPVIALCTDGSGVTGELLAEAPQEKARLSDCLNLPNTFLCMKTDEKMRYINKEALQKVVYKDKAKPR